jgi:hypothetical protein
MKTIFDKLISNFLTLQPNILIEPIIGEDDLEWVVEANKKQLQESKNIEGESLGEYSDNTATRYNDLRQTKVSIGESVKLKDTGSLYDSIRAEIDGNQIRVEADYDDAIMGKLEETYGEFIGLTEENEEKLRERLTPDLRFEIKNKLLIR